MLSPTVLDIRECNFICINFRERPAFVLRTLYSVWLLVSQRVWLFYVIIMLTIILQSVQLLSLPFLVFHTLLFQLDLLFIRK